MYLHIFGTINTIKSSSHLHCCGKLFFYCKVLTNILSSFMFVCMLAGYEFSNKQEKDISKNKEGEKSFIFCTLTYYTHYYRHHHHRDHHRPPPSFTYFNENRRMPPPAKSYERCSTRHQFTLDVPQPPSIRVPIDLT